MHRRLISLLLILFPYLCFGANVYTDTGDHKWSTDANWSAGHKPLSTEDVTLNSGTTALNIDSAAVAKSFDGTGTAGVAISGSSDWTISGAFLCDSNCNPTYSGALSITPSASSSLNFGGKNWSGSTTVTNSGNDEVVISDLVPNTFNNLTIVLTTSGTGDYVAISTRSNFTITGTLTFTGNGTSGGTSSRGLFKGYAKGTQITITIGTVVMTSGSKMDFQDIKFSSAVDLSSYASGDCGGNSNITFRTATTYWLAAGSTTNISDNGDVWSATDDGSGRTPGGTSVFPLPQDAIIIDNNSWTSDSSNNMIGFHSGGRTGSVDASALTSKTGWINYPRTEFGDIKLTGSSVAINNYATQHIDGRVKYERTGQPLDIYATSCTGSPCNTNVASDCSSSHCNLIIDSYGGSIRLRGNVTSTVLTLTRGNLDLNGYTLTCDSVSGSGVTLSSSACGGRIISGGTTYWAGSPCTNMSTISGSQTFSTSSGSQTLTIQ